MNATVDLHTRYLGFKLRGPLIIGASPISENLDLTRRLVDAGAGAVVMNSLFEEQLVADQAAMARHVLDVSDTFAEALNFFPAMDNHHAGAEHYLKRIEALRAALPEDVPVIASLNGTSVGGLDESYARQIADAGADAIELNVYHLAMDPDETAAEVEDRYIDILDGVKDEVELPVAVKLSPFFSSPVHFMRRLADTSADGLVLFNRFYQPDIDVDQLTAAPTLRLSDSSELLSAPALAGGRLRPRRGRPLRQRRRAHRRRRREGDDDGRLLRPARQFPAARGPGRASCACSAT
jgi:dihydroorotate dehydrogenase (fumarate)